MQLTFVFLCTIALAQSQVYMSYVYNTINCTGSPVSATFFTLSQCFPVSLAAGKLSYKTYTSRSSVFTDLYDSKDCTGISTSTISRFQGCQQRSNYNSTFGEVSTTFRVAPGVNDFVNQTYSQVECKGTPFTGTLFYGTPSVNSMCLVNSSDTLGYASGNKVTGAGYLLPTGKPNESHRIVSKISFFLVAIFSTIF